MSARRWTPRTAATIVVGMLLAACASTPAPTARPVPTTPRSVPPASPSPAAAPPSTPSPAPDSGVPAAWTATGNMVALRVGHVAILLPDGRVLVAGGQDRETARMTDAAPVQLASAEIYDPRTGRWTATGSMAVARFGHAATLLPDGRVLVMGGYDFEAARVAGVEIMGRTTAELYDPATGRWTPTASMAIGRGGQTATPLADGRVLVAGGGLAGDDAARSAERYEPASGRWTATGSMADARHRHTATLLPDGRLLVAGGMGMGSEPSPVPSAELYDPRSESWTATGNLASVRFVTTATPLADGRVFLVGGGFGVGTVTAELYDPASGTWTPAASIGSGRGGQTATLLPDGTVLVVGGGEEDASARSAGLYDPGFGTWTPTASMDQARVGHTATVLADGSVLVAGGDYGAAASSADPPIGSAELYRPRK